MAGNTPYPACALCVHLDMSGIYCEHPPTVVDLACAFAAAIGPYKGEQHPVLIDWQQWFDWADAAAAIALDGDQEAPWTVDLLAAGDEALKHTRWEAAAIVNGILYVFGESGQEPSDPERIGPFARRQEALNGR